MPLDVQHVARSHRLRLSGLDILEDRWLLSAVPAAGPLLSVVSVARPAEVADAIDVTTTPLQTDDGSTAAANGDAFLGAPSGGFAGPVPTTIDDAGFVSAPGDNGSVTGPVAASPDTASLDGDVTIATGLPVQGTAGNLVGINPQPATVSVPSALPWGERASSIGRGGFKRAPNGAIPGSPAIDIVSTTSVAGERARQPSSDFFTEGDDDFDVESALVTQSDDEIDFETDGVAGRAVTVKLDVHRREFGVPTWQPTFGRNRDSSAPGCIGRESPQASDDAATQASPRIRANSSRVYLTRPADLLEQFVPFDRGELERSVDRVLARFRELDVGPGTGRGTDWRFAFLIAPTAAIGAAVLVHYRRRWGLNDERDASAQLAAHALGLPGHPRHWACEPR